MAGSTIEGIVKTLPGVVAGADLSAASVVGKFVKYNGTDMQVILCAAATDVPCGVLLAPAASSAVGEPVAVAVEGLVQVQAGATLTQGNQIGTNASGQAVALTPGTDTTKYVVGQVTRVGGATSGQLLAAAINCYAPHRAA